LITPYGSESLAPRIVRDADRKRMIEDGLPALESAMLSSAAAANAVMLGAGYFNPLSGYQNRDDALSVSLEMRTSSGLFWPFPVLNLTKSEITSGPGDRIALLDPNSSNNAILAVQTIEKIETLSRAEMSEIARSVFGTLDEKHPGVATFLAQGQTLIAGPIDVLDFSYFGKDYPDTFATAYEIRAEFKRRGWDRVVAFQTRNPMHRAHEELCKMALKDLHADGVLIHMLLGKLKEGDIPAAVRDSAIRKMVDLYFPANTVMVSGYGFDMLYAGPREAILHAIIRQNAGCSHLIVGRDHAGVGDYYGPFEAQEIFTEPGPSVALEIGIYQADHTAFSKKLGKVVMMRDVPDHRQEDFVLLSGTKVREMLGAGQPLPPEFARPEVAEILMQYYTQELDKR
jgi:sulfate adenylyltransferase